MNDSRNIDDDPTNDTDMTPGKQDAALVIPRSLAREGHVVWFYQQKKYLGFEWCESSKEIQKRHVADSENAIYFDTYAHAVVSSDRLVTPSLILYSPGKGKPPIMKG